MPINVWDYLREYDELRDEILAAVDRVFRSGRLILGQEGIKFEQEMAAYLGVSGGVGVNSGTDAIYIALAALGVKAGDEVITVPNTAVPTVSAIRTLGATPVFVDIRDEDFLMDVEQVEAAITPRTKAIVPVHLYGQCVDLDPLMAVAERHGLKVMEDCAQSQGALYKNHQAGSVGHASSFSFYPTKVLGAYGDGGMVLSNDEAVIRLARSLRFYGMETQYYSERHGYNSRLDEVQAAILSLKLPRDRGLDRTPPRHRRALRPGACRKRAGVAARECPQPARLLRLRRRASDRSRRRAGAAGQARHQLQCVLSLADPHHARQCRSRLSRGPVPGGGTQGAADFLAADVSAPEGRGSRHRHRHAEGSDLMAERAHLDWFRERIASSRAIEPKDPAPLLAWRERSCAARSGSRRN